MWYSTLGDRPICGTVLEGTVQYVVQYFRGPSNMWYSTLGAVQYVVQHFRGPSNMWYSTLGDRPICGTVL